jgi:EAL domain-containing protein (putative c-di-GMP-specific phosphodiesterase class I)
MRHEAAARVRRRLPGHPLPLLGGAIALAVAAAAVTLPRAQAVTASDTLQLLAIGIAVAALVLGLWRAAAERRRAILAMLATMLFAGAGMALQVVEPAAVGDEAPTLLYLLAVLTMVGLFSAAICRGLDRKTVIGTSLDALITFGASSLVVGAAWSALVLPQVPVVTLATLQLLMVLGAWSLAASLMLLARGIRPTGSGPWAVMAGALLVAIGAAAWRVLAATVPDPATAHLPTELLLPVGVLLAAHGSLTWTLASEGSERLEAGARKVADVVPMAAVGVVLVLDVLTLGAPGFLFVQVGLVVLILITAVRQLLLRLETRRLEVAGRAAEARLLVQTADRDTALRSMTRLEAGGSLRETASRIVAEVLSLHGIDAAWVSTIADDGVARVLATAGLPAGALMGRAATPGPGSTAIDVGSVIVWREHPAPGGHGHLGDLAAIGVLATLVAPIRWEERLVGYVAMGTRSALAAEGMSQRAATARELSVIAASLMGPTLAAEEHVRRSRAEIDTLIAARTFHPVFQPIASLATGRVVGYEALTRFADGRRPDLVFETARVAGRGKELEVATLAAAIAEAGRLDASAYLSLNISPDLAVAPEHLGPVLERAGRDIVLEITEHVPVADYERLMATLYALDLRIRIAVDDAGAGYSGLQHILAIRPQLIKLDISLVRSVDVDIARQALISGMAGFGRRMGALLVAEGVERQEESDMLRSLGVDLVQGYLVGRPARADTFSAMPAPSDAPAPSDLPALEAGRLTDPATA